MWDLQKLLAFRLSEFLERGVWGDEVRTLSDFCTWMEKNFRGSHRNYFMNLNISDRRVLSMKDVPSYSEALEIDREFLEWVIAGTKNSGNVFFKQLIEQNIIMLIMEEVIDLINIPREIVLEFGEGRRKSESLKLTNEEFELLQDGVYPIWAAIGFEYIFPATRSPGDFLFHVWHDISEEVSEKGIRKGDLLYCSWPHLNPERKSKIFINEDNRVAAGESQYRPQVISGSYSLMNSEKISIPRPRGHG